MDSLPIHEAIRQVAKTSKELLQAKSLGVPAPAMARMANEGVLERVVTGVYIGANHERHPLIESAGWSLRYPRMVAALLTAAAYHELTDAFARGAWLFVPKGTSVPRSRVAPLHVVQIAPRWIDPEHELNLGIETLEVHGVKLRITGPDRTALDLWRYPRRIPAEHALEALRRRVRGGGFHLPGFARLAKRLGVWTQLESLIQGMML